MDSSSSAKVKHIIAARVLLYRKDGREKIIREASQSFLGTPYQANILIGSASQPEQMVVNLHGVDCFTFLDYVHTLSRLGSEADFLNQLVKTRYKDGEISFVKRKHFFTDWYASMPQNALDVTAAVSPDPVTVQKQLNLKADGSRILPGLGIFDRKITPNIPTDKINPVCAHRIADG